MGGTPPLSPLAPNSFPALPDIAGLRLCTLEAGFRYKGRTDLLVAVMEEGAGAAGVFTRSATAGAPVSWCRRALAEGGDRGRVLIVTAGNSNAFTGRRGQEAVTQMARSTAQQVGCAAEQVLIAQTGVIGEPFPADRYVSALPTVLNRLARPDWEAAARAIMTTDTFPKGAAATTSIGGQQVQIAGIAKGSGMIAPDMATMLGFLFTDARLPGSVLQPLLAEAVSSTFNCITVDSDTSTSDSLTLMATAKAGPRVTDPTDPALEEFRKALKAVCQDLAWQIVRDGEGASKFIEVTVSGAASSASARTIALAIANSPLVKTAIAGEDANWGRVVAAVGKAGEPADRDRLAIWFGDLLIAEHGMRADGYDEDKASAYMTGENIAIRVDVGVGDATATVWTCDLTHGYIDINADYRS